MQVVEEKIRTVDGCLAIKRYVVVEKVGEGAFSQCFKVQVLGSEQIFAMKIISKQKMQILQREKLVEEIHIHQTLSHPNIVFLDHWFEDQSCQYIFLEFCAKKTLEERCKKYEGIDERHICRYGMQILQALKYLHSKLVLHRDLKLSNFFLNSEDQIKLGDFGFACRLQSENQMKREACGTPNYTPPEVVIGQGYTTSADLWSFGVILYRMKYGVCPFEMPELRDTLKKIKEGSFIIPRWNSASPEIVDLIHKLLVVDAEARLTISQVLDHPFFKKSEEEISKGGGLRNLMQRLFSTEKGDRSTDKRRMDSCESKKDIKNILKQRTGDTPTNRDTIINSTLMTKISQKTNLDEGSRTDRPRSPKRSESSNKERLLKLLKKDRNYEEKESSKKDIERSSRKQSPPRRQHQTLKLADPAKIQQEMNDRNTIVEPLPPKQDPLISNKNQQQQSSSESPTTASHSAPIATQKIVNIGQGLIPAPQIFHFLPSLPTLITSPANSLSTPSAPQANTNTHNQLIDTKSVISQTTFNMTGMSASTPTKKLSTSESILARLHAAKIRQTSFNNQSDLKREQPSRTEFNMSFKPEQSKPEALSLSHNLQRIDHTFGYMDLTFGKDTFLNKEDPAKQQSLYRTEVVAKIEDGSTASNEQPSRMSENPLDKIHRMKNRIKQTHISSSNTAGNTLLVNSITDHYPFYLLYQIQVINEHYIIYLTNGIRQIIKGKEIYAIFEPGRCFDRDGLELKQPPKMIDYISRQKMLQPFVPLTQDSFKTLLDKKHLISKWRVLQGRMVFSMLSATSMTTSKITVFYIKTSQFEHLYNTKLQIISDKEELLKCRSVFEEIQKGRTQKNNSRSTSRNRKLLE